MNQRPLKTERNLRVGTLMKRKRELDEELRVLNARKVRLEAQLREAIGLGFQVVDRYQDTWYRGTYQEEERNVLDPKKVAQYLSAEVMAKCYKPSKSRRLYVTPISKKDAQTFMRSC